MRLGLGLGLSRGAGGAAASLPGVLRAASPLNMVPTFAEAMNAGLDSFTLTMPHFIGSGDRKSLRALFNFWLLAVSGTSATTAIGNNGTIQGIWFQYNGVLVQGKFSGVNTLAWTDGDFDVSTDAVVPSDFGASTFALGDQVLIHVWGTTSVTAGKLPSNEFDNSRYVSGITQRAFDSALVTPTIGLGGFTWSGATAGSVRKFIVNLVGEFVDGAAPDKETYMFTGDSMYHGSYDEQSGTPAPRGVAFRFLEGTGGTNRKAGFVVARGGGLNDPWNATTNRNKIEAIVKYCSTAVDNYLRNHFSAIVANQFPTGEATMQATFVTMYANIRANALTGTGVLPLRCIRDVGGTWLTGASVTGSSPNQTSVATGSQDTRSIRWKGSAWAGTQGDCRKMQDYIASIVGTTGADAIWDNSSVTRASTDPNNTLYDLFPFGINTDGAHYGHTFAPTVASHGRADPVLAARA